ncbi:hypothetical protein KEM48_010850 [Puccinia striiformis f. sp. tritici PST-130]|nr:hypothetical protein KEM48_010850 [Puccinia striiformis f. sp. tritici PST-130]
MNYFIRSIPVTLLVLIGAFLKPKLQEAGVFRTIANVNNERCSRIEGLQACEDIFVDQPTGLAYLACSHRKDRANWLPALNVLKYENIQGQSSADYLTILDLNTHDHRKVKLTNLPESLLQEKALDEGSRGVILRFSSGHDISGKQGPGNTIYMTNSLNAHLRLLEIQPDNTLIVKEEYKVKLAFRSTLPRL